MRLACDRVWLRKGRRFLRRADAENWRLPFVALGREFFVLGRLGRDTTGKLDLREDGVVLGKGNIGFLICDIRRLLLGLREAVLRGSNVPLVNILHMFGIWVVLGVDLGLLSLEVDFVENTVELASFVFDLLLQGFLNAWTESLEKDRLCKSKEDLMVGSLHLNTDVLNVDINLGDFEEVLAITCVSSLSSNLEAETLATHEDIADANVLDGKEALLAIHVESDITEVHLDTGDSQHNLILFLIGNLFPAPAPIVVRAEFKNVGSEVVALDHEILDNDVDHGIRVLDTRDGNVPCVNQEPRNDDLGQVLDKMGLECRLSVFVVAKVKEQLLHSITESLVMWISIELVAEELDFIKDTIGVTPVFVAEEEVTVVVKRIPAGYQSSLQTQDYIRMTYHSSVEASCII